MLNIVLRHIHKHSDPLYLSAKTLVQFSLYKMLYVLITGFLIQNMMLICVRYMHVMHEVKPGFLCRWGKCWGCVTQMGHGCSRSSLSSSWLTHAYLCGDNRAQAWPTNVDNSGTSWVSFFLNLLSMFLNHHPCLSCNIILINQSEILGVR